MFDIIKAELADGFFKKFHTKRGLFRDERKRLRKIRDERKADVAKLKEYVTAIQAVNAKKVEDALIQEKGNNVKKGHLVLLEQEMKEVFKALHDILQEIDKMIVELETLIAEVRTRAKLPDSIKRVVIYDLNQILEIIDKALNNVIKDLGGIDSLTVSAFKARDRDSQISIAINEARQSIKDIRGYNRAYKEAGRQLKNFEKNHPPSNPDVSAYTDNGKIPFKKAVEKLVWDIIEDTDDLVMILQGIHSDYTEIVAGDQGKFDGDVKHVSAAHPPSLKLLKMPVKDHGGGYTGGYGIPNAAKDRLNNKANEIEKYYREEIRKIMGESRLFVSKVAHDKQAA